MARSAADEALELRSRSPRGKSQAASIETGSGHGTLPRAARWMSAALPVLEPYDRCPRARRPCRAQASSRSERLYRRASVPRPRAARRRGRRGCRARGSSPGAIRLRAPVVDAAIRCADRVPRARVAASPGLRVAAAGARLASMCRSATQVVVALARRSSRSASASGAPARREVRPAARASGRPDGAIDSRPRAAGSPAARKAGAHAMLAASPPARRPGKVARGPVARRHAPGRGRPRTHGTRPRTSSGLTDTRSIRVVGGIGHPRSNTAFPDRRRRVRTRKRADRRSWRANLPRGLLTREG